MKRLLLLPILLWLLAGCSVFRLQPEQSPSKPKEDHILAQRHAVQAIRDIVGSMASQIETLSVEVKKLSPILQTFSVEEEDLLEPVVETVEQLSHQVEELDLITSAFQDVIGKPKYRADSSEKELRRLSKTLVATAEKPRFLARFGGLKSPIDTLKLTVLIGGCLIALAATVIIYANYGKLAGSAAGLCSAAAVGTYVYFMYWDIVVIIGQALLVALSLVVLCWLLFNLLKERKFRDALVEGIKELPEEAMADIKKLRRLIGED